MFETELERIKYDLRLLEEQRSQATKIKSSALRLAANLKIHRMGKILKKLNEIIIRIIRLERYNDFKKDTKDMIERDVYGLAHITEQYIYHYQNIEVEELKEFSENPSDKEKMDAIKKINKSEEEIIRKLINWCLEAEKLLKYHKTSISTEKKEIKQEIKDIKKLIKDYVIMIKENHKEIKILKD